MANNFALHPFCSIFVISKQQHMARHNEMGRWGEDVAAEYLRQQGYVIRERDWKSGRRDIDIIAITPDALTVVFVEVKTRLPDSAAAPEDAVDAMKIRNLCGCRQLCEDARGGRGAAFRHHHGGRHERV